MKDHGHGDGPGVGTLGRGTEGVSGRGSGMLMVGHSGLGSGAVGTLGVGTVAGCWITPPVKYSSGLKKLEGFSSFLGILSFSSIYQPSTTEHTFNHTTVL